MNFRHDGEPIPGLPERLPEGEEILWQGAPSWRSLARRALLTRAVAIYFAVAGVLLALAARTEASLGDAVLIGTSVIPAALLAVGVLAAIAYATAKSTIYTITNRRVVLRYGVAMTLCANAPHVKIGSAALKLYPDGTGDLPLSLTGSDRFSYLVLWPNARPWRFNRPEPMLRCVPEAARVSAILAEALRAAHEAAAEERAAEERAAEREAAADAPAAAADPARFGGPAASDGRAAAGPERR
ncbi:MAG: photosynthetic complex putative assembly protein PuhB [Pseudomonadota bacterium]